MGCGKFNLIDKLALLLSIIGAINWGILGVLKKDLIAGVIGLDPGIANTIYIVVGACGLWSLVFVLPKSGKS